jgi:hypothetical protein
MFGSTIVEVGIGLVFIYFLISVICTNVNDLISRLVGWRSKDLEAGIRSMLGDPELMDKVWNHSLVRGMAGKQGKAPTHIPSNTFAVVLFDAMVPELGQPTGLESIRNAAIRMPDNPARQAIINILDTANGDLQQARVNAQNWFDSVMEQVSNEYKRKMQWLAIIVALIVTGILGVDSISLANTLYREPAVRAAVTSAAQSSQTTATTQSADVSKNVTATLSSLDSLTLPIGWNKIPVSLSEWAQKVLGMVLTALAASLGSPFWYDLLRNLMSLFNKDK